VNGRGHRDRAVPTANGVQQIVTSPAATGAAPSRKLAAPSAHCPPDAVAAERVALTVPAESPERLPQPEPTSFTRPSPPELHSPLRRVTFAVHVIPSGGAQTHVVQTRSSVTP
jgi:hypothetical protein